MVKQNVQKIGLFVGASMGFIHLCWALMVMFGWAQMYLNFIFGIHMIVPPYTVSPFSWGSAFLLVVVTSVLGYLFGLVFGWIWNKLISE